MRLFSEVRRGVQLASRFGVSMAAPLISRALQSKDPNLAAHRTAGRCTAADLGVAPLPEIVSNAHSDLLAPQQDPSFPHF